MNIWQTLLTTTQLIGKFFYLFLDISGIILGIHVSSIMLRLLYGWALHPYELIAALILWGAGAFVVHVTHYTVHFTGANLRIVNWLHEKLFGKEYFIARN